MRNVRLNRPLVPFLAVLALVLDLFMPLRLWRFLFIASGGLLALCAFWAVDLSRRLSLHRRSLHGWSRVGDLLIDEWTLSNDGRFPAPWLLIADRSTLPGYEASRCIRIGADTSFSWSVQARCRKRGRYTIGPVRLSCGDPFGIFSVSVEYPEVERVLVLPPLLPWDPLPGQPSGTGGERYLRARSARQSASAGEVREYLPGDSRKRIHWRTSARQGRLFVKQFDSPAEGDLLIVVDLEEQVQHGEGLEASDEHGIVLAAAIAHHSLRKGVRVGLLASSEPLLYLPCREGLHHERSVLVALAGAERAIERRREGVRQLERFVGIYLRAQYGPQPLSPVDRQELRSAFLAVKRRLLSRSARSVRSAPAVPPEG